MTDFRKFIAKPFVLKLELVKGCNLRCKFCPVNSKLEYQDPTKRSFIDKDLMVEICKGINILNDRIRVELTGRGEPTLHPFVLKRLRTMRRHIPASQVSLFTNGVLILKNHGLLIELLDSGCNILNIDCYNNTYDRFESIAKEQMIGRGDVELKDFRKFSAYKRHNRGENLRVVNLVPDIQDSDKLVPVREIHNMAGNLSNEQLDMFGLSPLKAPLKKMCVRPFREYQIHSDGVVSVCCHDWSEDLVLGKIESATDVVDIWYGKRHLDVLLALHNKDRTFSPCSSCDYFGGFRVGLVKNPVTGYDPFVH